MMKMNEVIYKDWAMTIEKGIHGSLLIWFHGELIILNTTQVKAIVNGFKELIDK